MGRARPVPVSSALARAAWRAVERGSAPRRARRRRVAGGGDALTGARSAVSSRARARRPRGLAWPAVRRRGWCNRSPRRPKSRKPAGAYPSYAGPGETCLGVEEAVGRVSKRCVPRPLLSAVDGPSKLRFRAPATSPRSPPAGKGTPPTAVGEVALVSVFRCGGRECLAILSIAQRVSPGRGFLVILRRPERVAILSIAKRVMRPASPGFRLASLIRS
jgi:hypothetical protein